MITFLILKVSGIPMLEKSFADNQNFQEYKERTSAFFPLPPKT
jgi:steroid 5-alpha reductase family enzyme